MINSMIKILKEEPSEWFKIFAHCEDLKLIIRNDVLNTLDVITLTHKNVFEYMKYLSELLVSYIESYEKLDSMDKDIVNELKGLISKASRLSYFNQNEFYTEKRIQDDLAEILLPQLDPNGIHISRDYMDKLGQNDKLSLLEKFNKLMNDLEKTKK